MRSLLYSTAAVATLASGAAQAQTPSEPPQTPPSAQEAQGETTNVDRVVVTARRRDEELRDIPAAIAVVTGDAITAQGPINSSGDILQTVPSTRFNNLQNPLLSEVSIRGSGTQRATGAESAVGLYSNGVYIGAVGLGGRNFTNIDSFDVDRVEVLEGPQGALYGRDAEFGVVNLVSARPRFADTGHVDAAYTLKSNRSQLTAVYNHAFDDEFAVRLGFQNISQSKGFVYNPESNDYYDVTEGWLGRAQLRFQRDRLDVDLLVEGQELLVPSFWSSWNIPQNVPGSVTAVPQIPNGFQQDRYVIPQSGDIYSRQNVSGEMLFVNYDFGWAKLSSTSSYRNQNTTLQFNTQNLSLDQEFIFQGTPVLPPNTPPRTGQNGEIGLYPFAIATNKAAIKTLYEDIHLGGSAFNEQLDWLAGLEVLQQRDDPDTSQTVGNPCTPFTVGTGICAGTPDNPVCYMGPSTPNPCPAPFGTGRALATPINWGSTSSVYLKYTSFAPYLSLSYRAGPATLTGDVRYSDDEKSATQTSYILYTQTARAFPSGGAVANPSTFDYSKDLLTYAVTASYKLPGDWGDLIYAKIGTGYRAGSFNYGQSPPTQAANPGLFLNGSAVPTGFHPVLPAYGPETSTSYEIGFKGNVTPLFYVALTAYLQQTKNALTSVGDGCTAQNTCGQAASPYTINGGTTHGSGVELEVATKLDIAGGVLSLDATGSHSEGKFVAVDPRAGSPVVGSQVAQNPRWLASLTANYSRPFGDDMRAFANVVYHGQWGGIQDTVIAGSYPETPLSDFQTVNLRTGVDFKPVEVALAVTNLTDEIYAQANFRLAGTVPLQQRWSLPRAYTIEVKYRW